VCIFLRGGGAHIVPDVGMHNHSDPLARTAPVCRSDVAAVAWELNGRATRQIDVRTALWLTYWVVAFAVTLAFVIAYTPFRLWFEGADPNEYP
jgi:hypothetical protein